MKTKALKTYIAGPISGMEEEAFRNFAKAEEELNSQGYAVLNPMIDAKFTLSFSYMDWIKHGLFLLDLADAIYMLPGWENSKGARLEHAYAECRGIKIIYAEEPAGEENCLKKKSA
ncbi:MAG: DUF4406 domain-containing protein [Peptostreptococcaceae bacterium]|nr:DUF4406 domain-containing protein [Peptostreptococcaceae bacterium]